MTKQTQVSLNTNFLYQCENFPSTCLRDEMCATCEQHIENYSLVRGDFNRVL